jgi:hypothetical protein
MDYCPDNIPLQLFKQINLVFTLNAPALPDRYHLDRSLPRFAV